MKQPIPHRRLKAEMILRGLSLRKVHKLAGVEYTRASEVLNGTRIDNAALQKLRKAIMAQPALEEAAA